MRLRMGLMHCRWRGSATRSTIGCDGKTWRCHRTHSWKPGQDKWQFFERKTSRRIENLGFVSPTNGWVVIQGGNIQFSKDGGKTWDRSVTPDPASGVTLQDVAYVDDKTLWAAGGKGTLYVSLDSGATWKSAPLELRRNLYRIIFSPDKKAGIVLGQNGALLNYQSQIQPS